MAQALAPLFSRTVDLGDVTAIVTDFDGVHTDDTVHVDQNGVESVTVSRSDGMGVEMLKAAGLRVLILSKERNPVVSARAKKLGVQCIQASDDKASALRDWALTERIPLDDIVYVGNDVNDLPALALVGWPTAVADAVPEVRAAARVTLSRPGGHGAIREIANLILNRKGHHS
jgi:YrbI family 3-deoxy-D-manno-octulosonate 8-phosphate phosphatase